MKTFAFLTLVAAVCIGCKTGPKFDPRAESNATAFAPIALSNRIDPTWLKAPTAPYQLGPGDAIHVEAIGDGLPTTTLNIGPDGKIYYSLLSGLSVWGLTLSETRTMLKTNLAKFMRAEPTVAVNLAGVSSQQIWMLGAMGSPGLYPLSTPLTLLEAIASAGGIASSGTKLDNGADFKRSFVLRNGHRLPVDFERLFNHGDMTQNIYLIKDDFVYLAPVSQASVYVLGALGSPNALPYSRELTLARVIAMSGGTIKWARAHKVIIVRGSLNQPRIAQVNYKEIITGKATDVPLEPGDIIYVQFEPYKFAAELLEQMLDQFVSTIAANEGTYIGSGRDNPVGINASVGTSVGGGVIVTP